MSATIPPIDDPAVSTHRRDGGASVVPLMTRRHHPEAESALDPLVEEITFAGLAMTGADPSVIRSGTDIAVVATTFSRLLEQICLPGRSIALLEMSNAPDDLGAPALSVSLLLGIGGALGTTAAEARAGAYAARRALGSHPAPFRIRWADPLEVLDVELPHALLLAQHLVSASDGIDEVSALSRWDRPADALLGLAHALCDRASATRVRTTLVATELGIDDQQWLRTQLAAARRMLQRAHDTDPELELRAGRAEITLLDLLESYRSPVFCGEVALLSDEPIEEVWARDVAGYVSVPFDVVRGASAPVVAARRRWVGGCVFETAPPRLGEALRAGLPVRGGLGPRRLVDLMSLTEAACAFQWPIPAGSAVPTIPAAAGMGLRAPAGLERTGIRLGTDTEGLEIFLGEDQRRSHGHLIGVTGSGKSTLIDRLIASDLAAGRPFALVDPHGDLARRAIQRARTTLGLAAVIDPDDPGTDRISLFDLGRGSTPDPAAVDRSVSRLAEAVTSHLPMEWSGPRFRSISRAVLTLLAYSGAGLEQFRSVLASEQRLERLLSATSDLPPFVRDELASFHHPSNNDRVAVANWVGSKYDELANSTALARVVAPAGSGLRLDEVIGLGLPVIANLAGAPGGDGRLLGHVLLGALFDAAFDRSPRDRTLFPVYVDEAHLFFVDNLERALNEGRKYGLSVTLAHQHLSQLPLRAREAVMGASQFKAVFRVTTQDAIELAAELGVRPQDLGGQPDLHAVISTRHHGASIPAYTCVVDPYERLSESP